MKTIITVVLCAVLSALLICPTSVRAIILLGSGDPTVNTTAPTGDRGWKFQGELTSHNVLGTVIGSRYILTTWHVHVSVGEEFVLNGIANTVIGVIDDTNSQLTVCKMQNSFGSSPTKWAALYESTNLIGKSFTVCGKGQQRGEPVVSQITNHTPFLITGITNRGPSFPTIELGVLGGDVGIHFVVQQSTNLQTWDTLAGTHVFSANEVVVSVPKTTNSTAFFRVMALTTITNGWYLGDVDLAKRWGENTVDSIIGEYLISSFDATSGNTNECMVTPYDSSGGLFIKDTADGKWKLAGINYGSFYWPWSFDGGMNTFGAALFDTTGLWYGLYPSVSYQQPDPSGQPVPSRVYHTSVSPRVAWIRWAMTQ